MAIQITKSLFRKNILHYRRLLESGEYVLRNEEMILGLKGFLKATPFKTIHVFLPIARNKEPDITPLFPWLWDSKKRILVSKTDFDSHVMHHFYLEPTTKLVSNKVGIPEPVDAKQADIKDVDVILIPLLLSDKRGNRIGYGGGFYDQLLTGTKALRVGLSLSPPLDELANAEEWDIPLNNLITPIQSYNYG